MKKVFNPLLAAIFTAAMVFASCGGSSAGKLICGVTEFEPMNYRDSSGNWIGFDCEVAILVGEKLGMKVEFQEIVWEKKYHELDSGSINAIWNGFTANATENGVPRANMVDFSYSYLRNQQCIVVRAERAGEFKSISDLSGKIAAAERGSAGESFAKDAIGNGRVLGASSYINTLLEVKSGAADFAVIDILFAQRVVGTADYTDIEIADITLEYEVFAVGFKKGSDLRQKVNNALKELYDEGKLHEIAVKYGLEDSLILDTGFRR